MKLIPLIFAIIMFFLYQNSFASSVAQCKDYQIQELEYMTKEELTGLYCSYFQASVDYLILTIELNKKIEDETVQDLYVSTGKCKELASRIQLILRKDHNIQSAIDYCNIANLERLRSLKIQ